MSDWLRRFHKWRRKRAYEKRWRDPKFLASVNAEMAEGVIAEIGETLEALGCGHGHSLSDTPPMFYPEWIRCVVAHHRCPE